MSLQTKQLTKMRYRRQSILECDDVAYTEGVDSNGDELIESNEEDVNKGHVGSDDHHESN